MIKKYKLIITIIVIIQILVIVLKLFGYLTISWFIILSPVEIVVILLLVLAYMLSQIARWDREFDDYERY